MKVMRPAVIVFGLCNAVVAVGFFFYQDWAVRLWPWPLRPLDSILLSSFLAAASAVIIWLGISEEWGAAAGAAMNVGLMDAGAAVYLLLAVRDSSGHGLSSRAIAFALFALMNGAVLVWSLRRPIRDSRRMSMPLRLHFVIFCTVLLFAAVKLLTRAPTIFPWPLRPENSTMYGLLFLGSFVYFFYPLFRPRWHNARGPLLAFLVYDLVLIPPYTRHFEHVPPTHLTSLCVYMAVMIFSALVAIYYLFIASSTRSWRTQSSPAHEAGSAKSHSATADLFSHL